MGIERRRQSGAREGEDVDFEVEEVMSPSSFVVLRIATSLTRIARMGANRSID